MNWKILVAAKLLLVGTQLVFLYDHFFLPFPFFLAAFSASRAKRSSSSFASIALAASSSLYLSTSFCRNSISRSRLVLLSTSARAASSSFLCRSSSAWVACSAAAASASSLCLRACFRRTTSTSAASWRSFNRAVSPPCWTLCNQFLMLLEDVMVSGVWAFSFLHATAAPRSSSRCTQSSWLPAAARCSARFLPSHSHSMFARQLSSATRIFWLPCLAARCRAVSPLWRAALG
mmetsp:Transcript_41138/g.78558  ORF Transcript_41138/g.78558 Transcript_41138/m.78558 type:complete len:233 (+) Transcript_41138:293-991(+)